MGGGSYSTDTHAARAATKKSEGYTSSFSHTEDIHAGRASGIHESLDPKSVNKEGEHADKNVRECMDSTEHPDATAIGVLFDVTGSMGAVPRVLQTKLPQLHGLLQRKGYVEDPQILFGAIGDAHSDRGPLQVGQFESDNRMDENLENIWLEGGGGGGNHESYELAAYFMARHTHLDSMKNRGKKGYLFLIGDERVYSTVNAQQVRDMIGGISSEQAENISTKALFEELEEKWHVFFLFASQGMYQVAQVLDATDDGVALGWRELLGENAIVLEDSEAVCETIALTLGMMEGTVALEDGMDDLREVGADSKAIEAAGKALALVGGGSSAVAETSGDVPGLDDGDSGSERL